MFQSLQISLVFKDNPQPLLISPLHVQYVEAVEVNLESNTSGEPLSTVNSGLPAKNHVAFLAKMKYGTGYIPNELGEKLSSSCQVVYV